ncbi:SusC/RagA family TonB-linked outer membrane protein [Parabacteroides pacaensis]|uniref:SusC/RagA family TonB-linked outer membrane protein n=1 Tax=Parabacteroides pacaensis TaxID=2086575 RepID=UPI000D111E86|nr:TonB-dependent receptor [Parabacteroides pacaensis]
MRKLYIVSMLLCILLSVFAQEKEFIVSGVVLDESGMELPGVNVYIKNKSGVGVATDLEGKFSIKATRGDRIVFSFMGFEEFSYFVEKAVSDLKIKLKESSVEIEGVVVTALGNVQRKISSVAAVSTIDVKELQVPATSMANILGGRMPGVMTVQSSGEPGKNLSEFWIRGIGTFGANSSALVLIDGLEGDLNSIDPADIESFSILKDASATAVYGVRGANGVVLVNTKRGQEGKLKITARANLTLSKLQRMPDYLGAYEYAQLANEARMVRGDSPLYSDADMEVIRYGLDKDLFPDINWQKEIVNPLSFQQTYYLSAQGGGSIAQYFLSFATSNESAAYKMDKESPYKANTGYNTYSFRSNLNINLTKTTNVYFGVDGFQSRKSQPGISNTDDLWAAQSQLTPLLVPIKYSTGHLPSYGAETNMSPYVMLNHMGYRTNETTSLKATVAIKQDLSFITEGLDLRIQGAYDNKIYFDESRVITPELYYASSRGVNGELQLAKRVESSTAAYSYGQRQYRKYHFEATANYSRKINTDHRVSALVYYYMSDSKDTQDIVKADAGDRSMIAIPKRYQGLSSRLTYGYKDTYFMDVNFGYTGSENFQSGQRFGFFPSVAVGWVLTNYGFVKKHLSWIEFLKIRASYGTVGNDKITNTRFPYLTRVNESASAGWLGPDGGITETSIGADNLMWEKAKKTNVGVDAQLFKGSVNFTIDYFHDQRDGIFQRRANIPSFAGLIQMPFGNVGKMKSYGSDGNISFIHDLNRDMSFTIRGNYSYSRNLVQNWEQAAPLYDYQRYSGYPHDALRGYVSLGLFRDEQDIKSSPAQSFSSEVLPGDIKYKDVNGDGVINSDDKVVLSNSSYPRLMYGFGGEFRYKNFTLGVLFKGTGNTAFYYVGQTVSQSGNSYVNGMGYVPFHAQQTGNVLNIVADPKNRWIPRDYALAHGIDPSLAENPNARFPRLTYGYNANNSQLSDFWKGNKRYLRLEEVTLNYNWKSDFFKKVGVSSIDLQLVGNNLLVWDDVDLFDPEQAQLNGRAYPIPVRFTFQLYIHF